MKNYHFLLILGLFSACINKNMYNQEKYVWARGKIKPFTTEAKDTAFHFVEITANQVSTELIAKNEKVWVFLWRSYCHGSLCYPPPSYEKMAKEKGLKLHIISESYDFRNISEYCKKTHYSQPFMYALSGSYYGTGLKKCREKFLKELLAVPAISDSLRYSSSFIFVDGKLTYYGNDYNAF